MRGVEANRQHHCSFMKHWTEDDVEHLKAEFKRLNFAALCLTLGRSPGGVMSKLTQLKLVRCEPRTWRYIKRGSGCTYITWNELKKIKGELQCSKN